MRPWRGLLEQREEALDAALAEAIASRDALAQQLVDAKSAFDNLEKHAAEERVHRRAGRVAAQDRIRRARR